VKNEKNYWIITPFVMGCVSQQQVDLNDLECEFTVICRKQVNRLGARYYSRGIDDKGNVSNFVESEQIVSIWPKGNQ